MNESLASILVISCSPNRANIIQNQFKELNIPYPVTIMEAWVPETSQDWLPPNILMWFQRLLCCTRSHIKALEIANSTDAYPFTIIMEDDAALHRTDFVPTVQTILEKWDTLVSPALMCCAGWIPNGTWTSYENKPSVPINPTYSLFKSMGIGLQAYIVKRGTLSSQLHMLIKPTWCEMSKAVTACHQIPFGQVREPDWMLTRVFSQQYVFPPVAIEQYNTTTTIVRQQEPNEYYYHPFFKGYESRRLAYWSYYDHPDTIVFAILAKNKATVLPFYLECVLKQTLNKKHIHLYIRTNDNTDNTADILKKFIDTHGHQYASVYFDDSSVSDSLKSYKPHEWNSIRFSILGKIRQDSVNHAMKLGAHYFVADCDNFIIPSTLERMLEQKDLGVVAPMLVTKTAYSNFHYDVDANGYLKDHTNYLKLLNRIISGCIDVKVVHCTYFIANHLLFRINYDDKSARYEYVIFSDELRKHGIPQYLDNRQYYGFLTFADTEADFTKELSESYKFHVDTYFR